MPAGINIIVPIHNARELVQRCVESVLRHSEGDYRLILIDDASTDPELVAYLDRIDAAHLNVRLTHVPVNGGFVKSVNLGLQQSIGRDVLLLNSDAIVTPEYLTRIRDCAYADDRTGIVTPFSNNATICSMPRFCEDNPHPPFEDLDEYAQIVSQCSMKRRPEIVTAVGFCMFIRAAVLNEIGMFDERYGKGFCEENDFCELAKAAGWKIRLADDVFVAHLGKASFGAVGFQYANDNAKLLLERFPNYLRDVADFCAADPLREVRENAIYHLDRSRYLRHAAVLHLLHADPFRQEAGGTEFHVLDLVASMRAPRAVIAYREADAVIAAEVRDGDVHHPLLHRFPVSGPYQRRVLENEELETLAGSLLDLFRVGVVHIHHLFGWPVRVVNTFQARGVPYHYTAHDYYCVCPNNNLLDYSRLEPCNAQCDGARAKACLSAFQKVNGGDLITLGARSSHKARFREALAGAESVIFPSQKARELVEAAVADTQINSKVIPHGVRPAALPAARVRDAHEPLRVAFLGCINFPLKGSANYLSLIRALGSESIEWHFFGDLSAFDFQETASEIPTAGAKRFHGFYNREEIVGKLAANAVDLVVLAAPWHETFSYTLSEAQSAGIPVAALRRGAIGERLDAMGLETALADSMPELIEVVRSAVRRPERISLWTDRIRQHPHRSLSEATAETYDLYRSALASASKTLPMPNREQSPAFAAWWQAQRAAQTSRNPLIDVEQSYPAFWYGAYRSVRGALPGALRDRVRNRVVEKKSAWMKTFQSSSLAEDWVISSDTVCRPQGSRVELSARCADPYVILPSTALGPGRPDYLRLRLRTPQCIDANLQLYWVHQTGESFHEDKSLRIPLAKTDEWQDYVIDLRRASSGHAGIQHLRLDPIDRPGSVVLDSISFGKFKP